MSMFSCQVTPSCHVTPPCRRRARLLNGDDLHVSDQRHAAAAGPGGDLHGEQQADPLAAPHHLPAQVGKPAPSSGPGPRPPAPSPSPRPPTTGPRPRPPAPGPRPPIPGPRPPAPDWNRSIRSLVALGAATWRIKTKPIM